MSDYKVRQYTEMLGKVFTSVKQIENSALVFHCVDGQIFTFYHEQDCCEDVYIQDVVGDLVDLENWPLLEAEEVVSRMSSEEACESGTWTFYKFATIKGHVNVRWNGQSNGYYSESVSLGITSISGLEELYD